MSYTQFGVKIIHHHIKLDWLNLITVVAGILKKERIAVGLIVF